MDRHRQQHYMHSNNNDNTQSRFQDSTQSNLGGRAGNLLGFICQGQRNGFRLILESKNKMSIYIPPVTRVRGIHVATNIQRSGDTCNFFVS